MTKKAYEHENVGAPIKKFSKYFGGLSQNRVVIQTCAFRPQVTHFIFGSFCRHVKSVSLFLYVIVQQ